METVLVTGAAGYIGSVLVPKLLAKGYRVKALDRFFFGEDKLVPHQHLTTIQEDSRKITKDIFDSVDYVIDLVAISNDPSGELFEESTWQINHHGRVNTAKLAKEQGVKRYILPSSCSIYGFQPELVDESAITNPLTVYAKANEKAESGVLALANENFCVSVMRQSTIFGYGRRMRFDLAINGMTLGAFKQGVLPLMRDGSQYRPMLHIQDTTDVMCLLLTVDANKINNEIFNVGSDENNYQLGVLGQKVADCVGQHMNKKIPIEWYGDPDHRSYKVSFDKIEKVLGWKAQWNAEKGVKEIIEKLLNGELVETEDSLTLPWYQELIKWHAIIKRIEMHGGMVDINMEVDK
ncbi:MAG: nucleoside-diphosphate-sugar epimerase [Cognaticolwellia sp.]|jgi:nucleoside-diphosphate-sugar epimerase